MPRDAVSRTANVERTGGHKWVNLTRPTPGIEPGGRIEVWGSNSGHADKSHNLTGSYFWNL